MDETPTAHNIGVYVRYLRTQFSWSYRDLSERAGGLSIGYLHDIEAGRGVPTLTSIEKLAGAFGMSLPVFFGGVDLELAVDERRLLEAFRAGDTNGMLRVIVETTR